jgi:hypothetical protein
LVSDVPLVFKTSAIFMSAKQEKAKMAPGMEAYSRCVESETFGSVDAWSDTQPRLRSTAIFQRSNLMFRSSSVRRGTNLSRVTSPRDFRSQTSIPSADPAEIRRKWTLSGMF